MKVKTSEMKERTLDWAASKCEGIEWEPGDLAAGHYGPGFAPSTDWAHGGPIIERECIAVWWCDVLVDEDGNIQREAAWYAENDVGRERQIGNTPLIAAMRCYVASRLGDEVEVPDSLTNI